MKSTVTRYMVSLAALPALWFAAFFSIEAATGSVEPSDVRLVECGRHLTDPGADLPVAKSVRVLLVTDEEWRAEVPESSGAAARHTLLDAASLFRGLSIHLLPVRTVPWNSPAEAATIRDIWAAARNEIPLGDADIAVVLTAQERATLQDGYAEVGGVYVAVARHPEHPERDALVLAHEISHLFGAHHGCDVPGREGLMAQQGFDRDLICPCTRRILELNADRFHEPQHE